MKAVVSGFAELWEVDELSNGLAEVSYFRALVRCQDVHLIPEALSLMVEDRRFRIPIVVESWEIAKSIPLGEALDQHLGLSTREAQEEFIVKTRFSSISAAKPASSAQAPSLRRGSGVGGGLLGTTAIVKPGGLFLARILIPASQSIRRPCRARVRPRLVLSTAAEQALALLREDSWCPLVWAILWVTLCSCQEGRWSLVY